MTLEFLRQRWVGSLAVFSVAAAGIVAVATAASDSDATAGPAYPIQSLRLVVPYSPGGTADILARVVGDKLQSELGQTVVVENRAGAGTAIGARYVQQSAPDGYTLFLGTSTSHAINPAVHADVGYDPNADFTAIAGLTEVPYAIVANPATGLHTLAELVEFAKAHPRELNYASAGAGSANHLAGELLARATGIDMVHVPYRGSAPALNDVLAGQVEFMFDLVTTSRSHVEGKALNALAVTSQARFPGLSEVPTTAESGYPDIRLTSWFGLFAPAGLPEEVSGTLTAATAKVLADPAVRQRLEELGMTLLDADADAFAELVRQDYAAWASLVADANITLQ